MTRYIFSQGKVVVDQSLYRPLKKEGAKHSESVVLLITALTPTSGSTDQLDSIGHKKHKTRKISHTVTEKSPGDQEIANLTSESNE